MADVTLDLRTLTLGEMAALEEETGRDFAKMLTAGSATRRLLALWVAEQRSSEPRRSWSDLSNLTLSDVSSSTSPSQPDGAPTPSAD